MVPGSFLWQRVKDSNPHIQSQSLLCYLYTNPLSLFCFVVVHRSNKSYYIQNLLFVNTFFEIFFIYFLRVFSSLAPAPKGCYHAP